MALNLQHQTATQFADRLRQRYRSSSKEENARLATWIMDHIDAGDFTATQVRSAFELTAGQWTTLAGKMNALRTSYNSMQAASGE